MKILIILLLIIIGSCLANSYLYESFVNESKRYGNGEDYYPNQYVDNSCPFSSCIQQPCVSTYKS